jgi:fucokinase
MKNLYSLFLFQAYQDCWDDYNRSLKLRNFPKWDYVILTASNEQQAEGFRKQIDERKKFLPAGDYSGAQSPDRWLRKPRNNQRNKHF